MNMIKNANKPEIKKPMHFYDSETKNTSVPKDDKDTSLSANFSNMQNSFPHENCWHKYLLNQIRELKELANNLHQRCQILEEQLENCPNLEKMKRKFLTAIAMSVLVLCYVDLGSKGPSTSYMYVKE